jgi:hypothetical protein
LQVIGGIYAGQARAHDQYIEMFQSHRPLQIAASMDIHRFPFFHVCFERMKVYSPAKAVSEKRGNPEARGANRVGHGRYQFARDTVLRKNSA